MSRQIAMAFRKYFGNIIYGFEKFISVEPQKKTGKPRTLQQRILFDGEKFAADPKHSKQTRKVQLFSFRSLSVCLSNFMFLTPDCVRCSFWSCSFTRSCLSDLWWRAQ